MPHQIGGMISHPDRIGPYRIVRILGQGGTGLVQVLAVRDSTGDTLEKVARAQVVKLYEGWGRIEQAADCRARSL